MLFGSLYACFQHIFSMSTIRIFPGEIEKCIAWIKHVLLSRQVLDDKLMKVLLTYSEFVIDHLLVNCCNCVHLFIFQANDRSSSESCG